MNGRSPAFALRLTLFTVGWQATPHSHGGEIPSPIRHYPKHTSIVDVTLPPYAAMGDVKTDDIAALQRAINEVTGQHKILYFPKGVWRHRDHDHFQISRPYPAVMVQQPMRNVISKITRQKPPSIRITFSQVEQGTSQQSREVTSRV